MGFEARRRACGAAIALVLAALAGPAPAQQSAPGPKIYSCRDASGKVIRSDRPPAGCLEMKEMNSDGSVRAEVPPPLSPAENAERQDCERKNTELRSEYRDRERGDRVLLQKFPTEAKHKKAREDALDDVRNAVKLSDQRIRDLLVERKKDIDEAEFYKGKELPPMLKQKLDSNDALLNAQKSLVQNQQLEATRINERFDTQLAYLRKLWSGNGVAPPQLLNCSAAAIRKDR